MTEVWERRIRTGRGAYPVRVRPGLVDELGREVAALRSEGRVAVISDATVAGLHGGRALEALRREGLDAQLLTFPPGERWKTRESWVALTDAMLARGLDRDTLVLALGGGVTGDLAGFVAATYLRGVPVVQVPTTLVAMVDASVGGKTGVDVPAGKNLVGAFHPPLAVLVDPQVIGTLPREERARGLAEVVKHGAVRSRAYLEVTARAASRILDGEPDGVEAVVRGSVELKAQVVEEDEREGGVRRILNFGHTLGHALEASTGFALSHGEAVAVGMVLEARLGELLGITEPGTASTLREVLETLELPTRPPAGIDPASVLSATRSDKKISRGSVRYSLLRALGEADPAGGEWVRPVPDALVLEVLTGEADEGGGVPPTGRRGW